jgi:acyl-CoA dehydrogenase
MLSWKNVHPYFRDKKATKTSETKMNLDFRPSWMNAELDLFRDNITRFLDTEVMPDDAASRERGHVGHAIWRRAGELGLLCTDIPTEYGGGGGDFRHEALVDDEMSRRGLTGMATSVHSIVAHYFLNHGTPEQRAHYLPKLASGELIGAIAMSEPGAGSDLQGIRTRADRIVDGDSNGDADAYVINGAKTFITNGYLAGVILLVVKTDASQGARGTSIIIIDTQDCAGFTVGRVLDKIGMKAQDTAELFFDNVRVPATALLGGKEGQGFFQLMADLPYERLIIGVAATAAIEGALALTLAYTQERKAFGKTLFEFQNTRFKLAEIAAIAKAARAFTDRCVEELVAGKLDTATASMIKMWATEQQGKVMDECLQLFGGYGYMNEYPIARMFADARVQRIYGGSNEIMREVIARAL